MSYLKILFSFHGRINRQQFWFGSMAPGLLLGVLFFSVGSNLFLQFEGQDIVLANIISALGKLVLPVATMLLLWGWMLSALYTKRLHDRDKSAAWLLAIYLPSLAPIFCYFFARDLISISSLIATISSFWVGIELGMMKGTEGPNQFDVEPVWKKRDQATGEDWDSTPESVGQRNYGGMAAALASIESAAQEKRAAIRTELAAKSTSFGQQMPQSFGHIAAGTSSGFGRKGL